MGLSIADRIARLPDEDKRTWLRSLTVSQRQDIATRPWWFVRRPEQCPPSGEWLVWLIRSGRGWGKTRTGSETILQWALDMPVFDGVPTEWAIIGETVRDAREICINGPSGLLNALRRRGLAEERDWTYNRQLGVITLLEHGTKFHVLGADDADVGRGLNLSGAWLDELAKWRYAYESWFEGILPALRIGPTPRCIVTTTPKPIKLLKEWLGDPDVRTTLGSTFENTSNLSRRAVEALKRKYEGTRLGRQELHGDLLLDLPGALWKRSQIDADRARVRSVEMYRIVVAVDPATTSGEDADETGIVVTGKGVDGRTYVLADRSLQDTPLTWAQAVVKAYDEFQANEVVAEVNQGGEMVTALLRQVRPSLPVTTIHAKKAKRVRAEPVAALYEQHLVVHVGEFPVLEDQLCTWTPEEKDSPDRMDALVYAVTALNEDGAALDWLNAAAQSLTCPSCGLPKVDGRCPVHG